MKFSQLLIALAVGLVIFIGLYMAEGARQSSFEQLNNPFENTMDMPSAIIIDAGELPQIIFNSDQELWQFYTGSEAHFENGQKKIVDGQVFASFNFIDSQSAEAIRHFVAPNFNPDTFVPAVGQIGIGPLGISAPGASFFIDRNKSGGVTKLYAYDHAIDIWFPGSQQPFVLPPKTRVTINDKVADRLGKLYYTKLKKDLRFAPFSLGVTELDISVEEAPQLRDQKLEEIKAFAQKLPGTWAWINPNSFMGELSTVIKYLQRDYALGISQELRKEYRFDELVNPFLSAYYHYRDNNAQNAESSVKDFITELTSIDWNRFMIQNPQFDKRWNFLGQNQKVWLHHAFQDDPEYVFAPVWFAHSRDNTLTDLETAFFEVEEMVTNQFTNKAKLGLASIKENLQSIEIESAEKQYITRIRRLLNEMIRQEIALQSQTAFELLQDLIELELSFYTDTNSAREELVLENAQDILYFLKIFIEDKAAAQINQRLVNSYSFLAIDQIEKNLGRQIFNQAEKETIKLVQFARAEDLTEDELSQLQKDKSLRDRIDERFTELEDNKSQAAEDIYDSNRVDNEEKLKSLLQEARVFTEGLRVDIKNATSSPTLVFSGAYYGDQLLSGTFRIDNQQFNLINMGGKRETFVDPRYLSSILRRIEKEIEDERIAQIAEVQYSGPSNNTPLAILQRKLVQETFEQEGLKTNRDNVLIISDDYNEFELTEVLLGKEYRLQFTYFQKEEYITNLIVEYVRNRFEFGDQVIPRKGVQNVIVKAVQERFQAGDTDPEQ